MEMKKLKVATARMAGYTGVLGPVRFKDGLSEEYLPRHIRDRMAASMEFLEVDTDGVEVPAGAQYRLITENAERAPIVQSLARQTDDEKLQEATQTALEADVAPVLSSRADLEKIADKSGIKGLREIGVKWKVKHRSIPTLIEMILDAQEKAVAARNKKLTDRVAAEAERLKTTSPQPAEVVEKPADGDPDNIVPDGLFDEDQALKDAAATGDLSAALNAETLLGSSVLASSYEIKGETVQLGDIVASAVERFGASAAEWNALADSDREDLLRLELDRRLAAE